MFECTLSPEAYSADSLLIINSFGYFLAGLEVFGLMSSPF